MLSTMTFRWLSNKLPATIVFFWEQFGLRMILNSVLCRMFLVVYSGRGLVFEGKPNLKLFDTLYWIFLFTVGTWLSINSLELFSSFYNLTALATIQCLGAAMVELVEKHKKNYVKGQCLNQTTFSSFGGKQRRNIFTGQETRLHFHFIHVAMVIEEMLLTEPFDPFQRKTTKSILTYFWAFYFGLFIPIRQLLCSRQELPEMFEKILKTNTCEFYARQPEKLSPRGPSYKLHVVPDRTILPPKSKHTIVQVEPMDIIQERNTTEGVAVNLQY